MPTLGEARPIIAAAGLPTDDLADAAGLILLGRQRDSRLIGVVGLQPLNGAALLRSLAVSPTERGRGLGAALVAAAEAYATRAGWRDVYLLTTDAAAFFGRLGYRSIAREDAPVSLRATRQFAGLCPATAQVMRKRVLLGAAGD